MPRRLRRLLPLALVFVIVGLGLCLVMLRGGVARRTILEPPGRTQQASITAPRPRWSTGVASRPPAPCVHTQSYSWGLAISPDQSRAALLRADAIEVVDLVAPYAIRRYPPRGTKVPAFGTGTYMGITFAPDGRSLFFGNANEGQILRLDLGSGSIVATIDIDGDGFEDSFVGDFVLTRDGRTIVAVDQFNFRLVTVDVASGTVRQSVRVGRHPFAVALSPDERTAWVSNVGMFEYPLIPGVTPDNRATAGITFPAYGVPSKEAEQGTMAEGQSMPGLGPLNHPDAMSVFKVDLASGHGDAEDPHRLPRGRRARRHPYRRWRQSWRPGGRARPRLRVQRHQRHDHRPRRGNRRATGRDRAERAAVSRHCAACCRSRSSCRRTSRASMSRAPG